MNILIIETGIIEQSLINLALKSRYLDHIYTASFEPLNNIPNIEYCDYNDLANKAKSLQIDIALVVDKKLIEDGIVEILQKSMLNVISVNKKWFNLENSRLIAKQLINHYSINNPQILKAPLSFPIVIKTDEPYSTKIAYSMKELIEIKETLSGNSVFLEEYLNGEIQYLLSMWDGKNLLHFPLSFVPTEVQQDRLDLYKTKLHFMLSDENANFIGFFISKLIWAKNDWYVLEYTMRINKKIKFDIIQKDFLTILNAAIYQKLDEIKF